MPANPLRTLQEIRHAEGRGATPAEKAINLELHLPEDVKAEKPPRGSSADDGDHRTLASAKASKHEAESPTTNQSYGLASEDRSELVADLDKSGGLSLLRGLSFLDRFLAFFVLLAMILGVVIGKFAPNVDIVLKQATFDGVSIPIVIGLLVMMWPLLTKVQYERMPMILGSSHVYRQIVISLFLNWIVGPFLMLALAWATLPDLPTYRTGVIIVGIARCIAMVMIWTQLAHGDIDYCAILVIINSVLQIILFAPMSVFFVNVISGETAESGGVRLEYGKTAIAVLIYLGIPLVAGIITRAIGLWSLGKRRFEAYFLPYFGPLALIGLLYTIILIFASQATRILDNIGPVFRTMVPMCLYFAVMWTGTLILFWRLSLRAGGHAKHGYKMAVTQAFTGAGSNFELAIAITIAIFGANSDQALAATIGPLVEVPVLLALTWVALYLEKRLNWGTPEPRNDEEALAR